MSTEDDVNTLEEGHVRETYRYLRLGLIGAAGLLTAAVVFERVLAGCWQGAISSYYYTPARSVFVGTLVAIGLSLIVIKGRGWEDLSLNLAGMLAPVVAFVPTTNVGSCWSIEPQPPPLQPKADPGDPTMFADWVVADIENNMWALIIAGALGVLLALFILWRGKSDFLWPFTVGSGRFSVLLGIGVVVLVIGGTAAALAWWDEFATQAHDYAAGGVFVFLAIASAINAKRADSGRYRMLYAAVALLMVAAVPVVLWLASQNPEWDHSILVLEFIEIGLFIVYWWAQTRQHWEEKVEAPAAT